MGGIHEDRLEFRPTAGVDRRVCLTAQSSYGTCHLSLAQNSTFLIGRQALKKFAKIIETAMVGVQ